MVSEATQLRQVAEQLRKEAADYEQRKTEKIAQLLQAGQALMLLKGKLSNVR